MTLYGDNDDFFGGQKREQDPLYAFQGHGIRTFRGGIWLALDATIESAGRTAGRSFDTTPLTLTITRSGSDLVLSYPEGTLQQSTNLGPAALWVPVPGATAPNTVVGPTNGSMFYRVQQ